MCHSITEGKNVGLHFFIGHILLSKYQLKHVIEANAEGRLDMTGGRGRRHKQLLDDLKEREDTRN
jgi:hypothetical protein